MMFLGIKMSCLMCADQHPACQPKLPGQPAIWPATQPQWAGVYDGPFTQIEYTKAVNQEALNRSLKSAELSLQLL